MDLSDLRELKPLPLIEHGIALKKMDWPGLLDDWFSKGPAIFLESAGQGNESSRWNILAADPVQEFYGDHGYSYIRGGRNEERVSKNLYQFLDEVGEEQRSGPLFPMNLSRAWFGVVSYEFGKADSLGKVARKQKGPGNTPGFYFFKPGRVLAYDRLTGEYFNFGGDPDCLSVRTAATRPFQASSLNPRATKAEYVDRVRKAQSYISDGDIYQANLSQVFEAQWQGSAVNLYRVLREINPSPFMGLFQADDFTIVSSSPERLVAGRGAWLETRPIAGTRPRGKDPTEDFQNVWELRSSPKEQAEHLMLVDLARNDLGRVAEFGSVQVKRFAEVESYAKVHHLVSILEARRKEGAGVSRVFRSMFPAGTITGCPKIRCMEIIDELESHNRGFYTGGMGYVAPGPCFDFNILIRSFTLRADGNLDFYAGAGIVADSDPGREYMETLYKVEALAQALGTTVLPIP